MHAALPLLRAACLAAVLSAFGACVFSLAVLRTGPGGGVAIDELPASDAAIRRIARISMLAAIPLTLVWLFAQAAEIAGTADFSTTLSALPDVVEYSRFGTLAAARIVLLVAAWLVIGTRAAWWSIIPVTAALWIQAGIGHAAAAGGLDGAELVGSEILHLTAAGAWLGGLLPLAAIICKAEPKSAAAIAHGFFPVGLACVLVLAGTGLVQGTALIGGLPGLVGTSYGRMALLKIGLFLALLALAAANRFKFTANLGTESRARRHLLLSVGAETVLGVAVVFAAAALAALPPGIHEQPLWPFGSRPQPRCAGRSRSEEGGGRGPGRTWRGSVRARGGRAGRLAALAGPGAWHRDHRAFGPPSGPAAGGG